MEASMQPRLVFRVSFQSTVVSISLHMQHRLLVERHVKTTVRICCWQKHLQKNPRVY